MKEMEPAVSVVMIIRNVEKYISKCIKSILSQTFDNFEVVVIDDFSSDLTGTIIKRFNDKRIRYFKNEKWLGISKSRNKSVKFARAKCLFFTDGDCTVPKTWIEEGLKYFKNPNCLGVEGAIYYVSKDYEPTFSDHIMENRFGGYFMTGNIAYRKKAIDTVGGFDERLTYFEDRDLALRIKKNGEICFNPEMIVFHQRTVLTPKEYVKRATSVKNRVHLFKKYGQKNSLIWRILFPNNILKIFFPPLILSSLFLKKFKNSEDFKLLPFVYIYVIYQRLQLWKECVKERVFLI